MRILGIDPGLTRCGVGIVTLTQERRVEFGHVEVLKSPIDASTQERVRIIGESFERMFTGEEKPDAIALERVFAKENLPSVMGVAHISGIVLFLASKARIPVTTYTPKEVKMRLTGYGGADKTQVTTMITKMLGLQHPPKPADAADALAIALIHAWTLARQSPHTRHGASLPSLQLGRSVSTELSEPTHSLAQTPAQKLWRETERKAAKRGRGFGIPKTKKE